MFDYLFIFSLGLIIGALFVRKAKNEEIAKLRITLAAGDAIVRQVQKTMAAFIERNKKAGILKYFTVDELVEEIGTRPEGKMEEEDNG